MAKFSKAAAEAIDIGSRLELFVDDYLVERLEGARLKLQEPREANVALQLDKPWEGRHCGYFTVIKDGSLYRMYYRGMPTAGGDCTTNEVTCYAESSDGINWIRPNLGFYEVQGTRENNIILANAAPVTHNFSPFLDTKPGVPQAERFKAVGGNEKSGLLPYLSADGVHWRKLRDEPILRGYAFDSQNLVFWSSGENCYVCYFRTWTKRNYAGFRTISRATSKDFLHWNEPVEMNFGDTPLEHLYTNQTHPYFRAEHIYVALAARFMPGRQVVTDEQAREIQVSEAYYKDCSETVLMTSRGGNRYTRTFMEAFVRPGIGASHWVSRTNYPALGVVPTGPTEMSFYMQRNSAQPTHHLRRYTLRTDGFISINAGYAGGQFVTKPLIFKGKELVINYSTSAAGSVRVEIQDVHGKPVTGYTLLECSEIFGDEIERVVAWQLGSDVSPLAGRPIRLRFVMKDADLYSIRFRP
ncbi:MAG: hypothetical protein J7J76_03835 [Candidatus Latescibacteria bacterium]|nr:hypothetical protein [Candidatus Latescibacterota bacterium]